MQPTEKLAYTYTEAGALLGISDQTIRKLVRSGALDGIRVFGMPRVTHRALMAYLSEREGAAQVPTMLRLATDQRSRRALPNGRTREQEHA